MILAIGDIMLDEYISGEVARLAPEAPVPVVSLDGGPPLLKLGGAANTAASVASLGEEVALVGPYGTDRAADLHRLCKASGITLLGEADTSRITTVKTRVIDHDGRLLIRLDRETPRDWLEWEAVLRGALASNPSTVVFSDYAKGCWTQPLWRTIVDYARARAEPGAVARLVVDAKRRLEQFEGAGIVKCNKAEWVRLGGDCFCPPRSHAVVTKGKAGLSYAEPADPAGLREWKDIRADEDIRAAKHDVHDVTGAGDVVTAVVAVGVCREIPLRRALESAVRAASASVTRPMTGVADPQDADL